MAVLHLAICMLVVGAVLLHAGAIKDPELALEGSEETTSIPDPLAHSPVSGHAVDETLEVKNRVPDMNATRIVIVAEGRSGSTLLMNLLSVLNNHMILFEPFNHFPPTEQHLDVNTSDRGQDRKKNHDKHHMRSDDDSEKSQRLSFEQLFDCSFARDPALLKKVIW